MELSSLLLLEHVCSFRFNKRIYEYEGAKKITRYTFLMIVTVVSLGFHIEDMASHISKDISLAKSK